MNPTERLSVSLCNCWAQATAGSGPEELERRWGAMYALIPPQEKQECQGLTPAEQRQVLDGLRTCTNAWAPWIIVRLSLQMPFCKWTVWQEAANLRYVYAVGQNTRDARLLPLYAFVLPRRGKKWKRFGIWPLQLTAFEQTLERVRPCLAWFCALNLGATFHNWFSLFLLATGTILLAFLPSIAHVEARLDQFLLAFLACSGLLTLFLISQVAKEISGVRREGWWRIWNDPERTIQVVQDPRIKGHTFDGDSYGTTLVAACLLGLLREVNSVAGTAGKPSRLRATIEALAAELQKWALTGSIRASAIGGCLLPANAGNKWGAVLAARLPHFLVPLSVDACIGEHSPFRRRASATRQRISCSLPTSLLRIAGVLRPGFTLLCAQTLVLCWGFLWTCWLVAGPAPSLMRATWSPITTDNQINILDLEFKWFPFPDPSQYFVVVQGYKEGSDPSEGTADASVASPAYGEALLGEDRPYSGKVRMRFDPPIPRLDPHRWQVQLFQRRSLLWWRLPTKRVRVFGLPGVEVDSK